MNCVIEINLCLVVVVVVVVTVISSAPLFLVDGFKSAPKSQSGLFEKECLEMIFESL
jgi:hypothetical protein